MLNTTTTETNPNVTTPNAPDGDGMGSESPEVTPPPDYGMDVILRTIGHASSTCECCGDLVDGETLGDWIICDLDVVDFSDESHALVCLECYGTKDWKTRVLERRREQQINSRLNKLAHWVTRAPAETLFLRRAAAGIALLLTALTLTTTMTALTSGLGSTIDFFASANWGLITLVGGLLLIGGYWLHLHEREKNDHRGTTVRELNLSDGPWSVLGFTSAGIVGSTAMIHVASSATVTFLGLSVYVASVAVAFKNLEVAVRADRCHKRVHWVPRYDRELFGLRASTVVGMGSLLVGFSLGALVPAVAIGAYLFARKWHDLGPNWQMLYYGSEGDDE